MNIDSRGWNYARNSEANDIRVECRPFYGKRRSLFFFFLSFECFLLHGARNRERPRCSQIVTFRSRRLPSSSTGSPQRVINRTPVSHLPAFVHEPKIARCFPTKRTAISRRKIYFNLRRETFKLSIYSETRSQKCYFFSRSIFRAQRAKTLEPFEKRCVRFQLV